MRTAQEIIQAWNKYCETHGKFANKDALATVFTAEEIAFIKNDLPRSAPAKWNADDTEWTWPKIGNYRHQMSSILTDEEHKHYTAYHKNKAKARGDTGSGTTRSSKFNIDMDGLNQFLADHPEDAEELLHRLGLYKETELEKLFGVKNAADLTKCTVHWLMFRGPNGERHENHMLSVAELGELFINGWQPVMTKAQIVDMLTKLKAKGEDYFAVVEGL